MLTVYAVTRTGRVIRYEPHKGSGFADTNARERFEHLLNTRHANDLRVVMLHDGDRVVERWNLADFA